MKIEEPKNYGFSLEGEEIDKLNISLPVLDDILKAIKSRNCELLVYGYPECEGYIFDEDIQRAFNTLSSLRNAWEMR